MKNTIRTSLPATHQSRDVHKLSIMNRTVSSFSVDRVSRLSITASPFLVKSRLVDTAAAGITRSDWAAAATSGYLWRLVDHHDSGQAVSATVGSEVYVDSCWSNNRDSGMEASAGVGKVWPSFCEAKYSAERSIAHEVDAWTRSITAMVASIALRLNLSPSNGVSLKRGSASDWTGKITTSEFKKCTENSW